MRGLVIEDGIPAFAAVPGFPDTAGGCAGVVDIGVARNAEDRGDAIAGGADVAELHGSVEGGLGGYGDVAFLFLREKGGDERSGEKDGEEKNRMARAEHTTTERMHCSLLQNQSGNARLRTWERADLKN